MAAARPPDVHALTDHHSRSLGQVLALVIGLFVVLHTVPSLTGQVFGFSILVSMCTRAVLHVVPTCSRGVDSGASIIAQASASLIGVGVFVHAVPILYAWGLIATSVSVWAASGTATVLEFMFLPFFRAMSTSESISWAVGAFIGLLGAMGSHAVRGNATPHVLRITMSS